MAPSALPRLMRHETRAATQRDRYPRACPTGCPWRMSAVRYVRAADSDRAGDRTLADMAKDEYLDMAESELEQAVQEWNETGELLTPDGRVRMAQVYSLLSIARSLERLADDRPSKLRAI